MYVVALTQIFSVTNISSSINDLRKATDETLPLAMAELGYDESFTLIDTKLFLGYATVVLAAGLFLIDKKMDFKDAYYITAAIVAVYGLLSAALLYVNHINKNVKYVGVHNKSGSKVSIASWTHNFDPIYHINVVVDGKSSAAVLEKIEFKNIFNYTGYINRGALVSSITPTLVSKKDQ